MQRTKYFDDTRPADTQLNYTENSRASAIQRRLLAAAQLGVVEGFRITINSLDSTKIDIGAGEGYTGGTYLINAFEGEGAGERISTTTDTITGTISVGTIIQGQALADYTLNTKNYVALVYSEDEGYPLSERSFPFTSHNTVVTDSYSVSVLTETAWNALSASEINNRVLVAIITAQGAGSALSSANIDQVVQPKGHPTAAQPSSITGVEITAISPETTLGNGTLRYDPTANTLYWTAPGDVEGSGAVISSSGTYTIYSDDVSYYVTLSVTFASLPAAATSETIEVRGLYGRGIPLFSAKDTAHRDLTGSGIPTVHNPHGITLDDIPGGTFDHADYFHVNGISNESVTTLLECTVDGINERILINNPGGTSDKFLIDGSQYTTINGIVAGTDGIVNFNVAPLPDNGRYLIYLDSGGNPNRVKVGEVLWDSDIRILDTNVSATGNATIAWDADEDTLTFTAPGDAAGAPVITQRGAGLLVGPTGIYKVYSNNGTDWVLVVCTGGSLGVTNSTTYAVEKSEASGSLTADETILKISVVTWDNGAGTLTDLDDLRRFVTADNRSEFEEEHDSDGGHTKVIQGQLRAATAYRALQGYASEYTGVYGYAVTNYGVVGVASGDIGVYGSAESTAVYGKAKSVTGVYGSASDKGGVFTAGAYAVSANAGVATAVYGSAADKAGYFLAANDVGVFASVGGDSGVAASADGVYGGSFYAASTALRGTALGNIGVQAIAADSAVWATATAAGGEAVYAAGETGVHAIGVAAGGTGVYGVVSSGHGIYGSVSTGFGVYGVAADCGVAGSGSLCGVSGVAGAAGGSGGYFSAALRCVILTGGPMEYGMGFTDAGALHSYVPLYVGGVEYRLQIYSVA